MYKCKHFKLQELVPESIYKERGEKAWSLLDDRALITIDVLREQFGPIVINDWLWGGPSHNRGLREFNTNVGAKYSQHKYGRAFDLSFKDVDTEEVRQYILENEEAFPYISGLEMGTPHLHFDVGNRPGNGIFTFNP